MYFLSLDYSIEKKQKTKNKTKKKKKKKQATLINCRLAVTCFSLPFHVGCDEILELKKKKRNSMVNLTQTVIAMASQSVFLAVSRGVLPKMKTEPSNMSAQCCAPPDGRSIIDG